MRERKRNDGLRKVCGCPRRNWPKCKHSWYLNYQPRGGKNHRLSLDKHFKRHIDSKTEAEELADDLKKVMRAGKFDQPVAPRESMTLDQLVDLYIERYVKVKRAARERDFCWQLDRIRRTVLPC